METLDTNTLSLKGIYDNDAEKHLLMLFDYSWRTISEIRVKPYTYFFDFKKGVMIISLRDKEVITGTRYNFATITEFEDYLIELKKIANEYDYNKVIKRFRLWKESEKGPSGKIINNAGTEVKEGMMLYTSWGYDQTNVEFFKVLRVLGKNYFIVQEVCGKLEYESGYGPMAGTKTASMVPVEGKLPEKAFVNDRGWMSLCESGYKRSLNIDDGKSHYTSWGH